MQWKRSDLSVFEGFVSVNAILLGGLYAKRCVKKCEFLAGLLMHYQKKPHRPERAVGLRRMHQC